MEIRRSTHPADLLRLTPEELRERFVIDDLFNMGEIKLVHVEADRIVVGGVMPTERPLALPCPDELRAEYFCERREIAIVALSGTSRIDVDGTRFDLAPDDVLYIGLGTRDVSFSSVDPDAALYLVSARVGIAHPTTHVPAGSAAQDRTGDTVHANARTINKAIQEGGAVEAAALSLGVTTLDTGSVWNTMPPHTHDRRTEIYLYFGLGDDLVVHLMGEPESTRSLILRDRQAVISPSWSIHCGAGTRAYKFVWATAGENRGWADMDHIEIARLR